MSNSEKIISGAEFINRLKLLMNYDMSKTLNENLIEQSVIGAPNQGSITKSSKTSSETPKEVQKDVWPIPGYKTYYIPEINSIKGGRRYMYLPLSAETSITLWEFPIPTDFPKIQEKELKVKGNVWWKPLTTEHLSKILPMGSVRNFVADNKLYLTSLSVTEKTNGYWVFNGYKDRNGNFYKSPDPEEYKNIWDNFVEKYGTATQITLSILAAIAIEWASWGTGTPLALKLLYEIELELLINVPFAIHEIKKGDEFGANLTIIFCFLPFVNTQLLGLGKISKTACEEMAKKLSTANIKNGTDLAKFYDNLPTDDEKYLLSMVLKQSPEVIENSIKGFIKNILNDPKFDKKLLRKIAFKDRLWWKDAGMQLTAALALIGLKLKFGNSFSQEQFKRMNDFVESILTEMGEENGQKIIAETFENPKLTDSLVTVALSDTLNPEVKKLVVDIAENLPYNPSETTIKLLRAKIDSIKKSKIKISPDTLSIYNEINPELDTKKDTIK